MTVPGNLSNVSTQLQFEIQCWLDKILLIIIYTKKWNKWVVELFSLWCIVFKALAWQRLIMIVTVAVETLQEWTWFIVQHLHLTDNAVWMRMLHSVVVVVVIVVVVVVIVVAQQLISCRQLSRLRKSATAAGLSHRSCTVSCVGWFWQLNRCSTECGATPHSGQTSDMLPKILLGSVKSRCK